MLVAVVVAIGLFSGFRCFGSKRAISVGGETFKHPTLLVLSDPKIPDPKCHAIPKVPLKDPRTTDCELQKEHNSD